MAELEGFLCPLCMADCRSVHELEAHYREEHAESTPSKLKSNFLNFVDIAKNTLKIDKSTKQVQDMGAGKTQERSGSYDGASSPFGMECRVVFWEPQKIGPMVKHTVKFRRLRDAHLSEKVVATNRLIIRLEKLFRLLKENTPRSAKQMKSVEQEVVPWKKDEDERQCQNCGREFGVRRRRHHCRLCGCIICKQCSQFLSLIETYPILHDCPDYHQLAPRPSPCRKVLQLNPRKREGKSPQRDGGGEEEDGSDAVRVCTSCKQLVDRHLVQLQAEKKSMLMSFYDDMHERMEESERLKPDFMEGANLLWCGQQHLVGLEAATKQRHELLKVYESIDALSKRIVSCGAADPSPLMQKLSRSIRVFASNYLQEHLLTLPSIPTTHQLQQIKEANEREAAERVREIEHQREEQRQLNLICDAKVAAAAAEKSGLEKLSASMDKSIDKLRDFSKDLQDKMMFKDEEGVERNRRVGERQGGGWMCAPDMGTSVNCEDDPFMVQREQLLWYITQARESRRMDEVLALEESLRDIELAMEDKH